MGTSELFDDITSQCLLGPSAEEALRQYLSRLDGVTLHNDIEEDD